MLRKATRHDYPEIAAIVKKGLQEYGFSYQKETSESDIENFDAFYTHPGCAFFVYVLGKHIVATGGIIKLDTNRFKIRKMYVDRAFRSKGIGKKILIQLQQFAIENHAKTLLLETSEKMKTAIAFYKSFGFKIGVSNIESPRCDVILYKNFYKNNLYLSYIINPNALK